MRLGINVAYKPWFSLTEQLELAVLSDRLGIDTVWVAESYGQDASVVLAAVAARTERVSLGSAVLQIPARQPTTTAMTASTLDQVSGGRFILGLGVSGPQVSEGWYGVAFTSPLGRTREYIDIVRSAWERKPVDHRGKHWSIPLVEGGAGLGKPIKMVGRPVQERIPIYLGVGGPKAVEQAGEIADGWLPFLFNPRDSEEQTAALHRGIAKAGRARGDISVTPVVPCAVHEDIGVARAQLRPILAMYLGGMGSKDKNFYVEVADRYGHGVSARACQESFLRGDLPGAQAALTDAVVDTFTIAATPKSLEDRLREFEDAGIDELAIVPFGDRPALIEMLATRFCKVAA